MEDRIECPLTGGMIEIWECVVCSDTASGMLKESCIPDKIQEEKKLERYM